MQQRFELPAFSTLDRLVLQVRHGVHQELYRRITASLGPAEMGRLDALLHVRDGRTDFNRIKETPRQATLTHLRQWAARLTWLESFYRLAPSSPRLPTQRCSSLPPKLQPSMSVTCVTSQSRPGAIVCSSVSSTQAQVQTRDELVEMLLKRMRHPTTAAQKHLKELQDHHRELEEQMLAVLAEVVNETLHTPEDNAAWDRESGLFYRTLGELKPCGTATRRCLPITTIIIGP